MQYGSILLIPLHRCGRNLIIKVLAPCEILRTAKKQDIQNTWGEFFPILASSTLHAFKDNEHATQTKQAYSILC